MAADRPAEHPSDPWDWNEVSRWCHQETRRTLGFTSAAEDAAQEATLRAWRRHDQCLGGGARRAWVKTIARNEAFRAAAGHRDEQELGEQHEALMSHDPNGTTAERLDIRRALGMLSDTDRRLLGLRYWSDLTQAEAATRLGLPEGTVKVRLHRLRATLRTQLA